jgi:group I intron endonuclease
MSGVIYYLYNRESGRGYVGKHCKSNIYTRPKAHLWDAVSRGINRPLHKALKKYGINSFNIVKLDEAYSLSELNDKEIYWIERLNTLWPSGYNMTTGGDGIPLGYHFGVCPPQRISAAIASNRSVTPEQVKAIRSSPEKNTWEWVTELGVTYETIMRIKKYQTFRNEK